MEAIITKIKLKKMFKNYYFALELHDELGNVYVVDKPFCNDEIQFRRMVFGIMAACNQFDLLKLGSNNPMYKEVKGYYYNGLEIIENNLDKWFLYNKKNGTYFCSESNKQIKELYDIAAKKNPFDVFVKQGRIESIISGSGVFQVFFNSNGVGTFMNTGQIYYGFGEPIGIGDPNNGESVKIATSAFQSFILSIMEFYGVNDLLELSGNVDRYPLVDIIVDGRKVTSITSLETGMGISIGKEYKIVKVLEHDHKKTLN